MRHLLLPLLALACAAAPAAAQVRIDGIVRDDSTGAPLDGARLELFDEFGHRLTGAVSDSTGNFRFTLRRLGGYRLRATRGGYPRAEGALRTGANPYLNVEVRLRAGTGLAAPVAVLARAQVLPAERLEGYHHRVRNGGGRYFTREIVDRLRPAYLAELVATTPGLSVARVGEEGEYRVLRGEGCDARVYVNGELVNDRRPDGTLAPAPLDNMVAAVQVEGIEVYPVPARVPVELGGDDAGCATVAVWTR